MSSGAREAGARGRATGPSDGADPRRDLAKDLVLAEFFTRKYALLWVLALSLALFRFVRDFIWVMAVRRAERDGSPDEERRIRLKRRAGATSALLSFVFSYLFVMHVLFGDGS